MTEYPCRQFCRFPRTAGCAATKCGLSALPMNEPRRWLGRGNESVPGKPFGWAHELERQAIRAHLRRRLWKFGLDGMAAARLEFRVTAIQERLQRQYHRDKPRIGARRVVTIEPPADFTPEELRHLVDLFDGANDPLSASIAAKARARLP